MKRILTVGMTYDGPDIEGLEIENFGFCRAHVEPERPAFPLYEYDTIIINPQSFSHFLFGQAGPHSESSNELSALKRDKNNHDLDTVFDGPDRRKELGAAIADGSTVIWCLAEAKRTNFFGYRETHIGYLSSKLKSMLKHTEILRKKGRRLKMLDLDTPFTRYFGIISRTGWSLCISTPEDLDGYNSITSTPEGYSLAGRVSLGATVGWLVTPPTSQQAVNQLARDGSAVDKKDLKLEKYHSLFLSHTSADKPFVRQLRNDLMAHGVQRVWLDEAEIEIGDSLIGKISDGMKLSRYIGVVLSTKSIDAPLGQERIRDSNE